MPRLRLHLCFTGMLCWLAHKSGSFALPNATELLSPPSGAGPGPAPGTGVPRGRRRRYLAPRDMSAILDYHNQVRAQVSPPAANMEYMVSAHRSCHGAGGCWGSVAQGSSRGCFAPVVQDGPPHTQSFPPGEAERVQDATQRIPCQSRCGSLISLPLGPFPLLQAGFSCSPGNAGRLPNPARVCRCPTGMLREGIKLLAPLQCPQPPGQGWTSSSQHGAPRCAQPSSSTDQGGPFWYLLEQKAPTPAEGDAPRVSPSHLGAGGAVRCSRAGS